MKLHQLVYFLQAAKNEHIGKAAKILAISPSAISHSIAALEEELGRQLFIKQGKHIFLTNHGKVLLERVSKLLNEIDVIKEEISSDQLELQGSYRLAGSHYLCPALLAPAWIALQEDHPKLLGEIFTLRSAQVLTGISSGEFDLGICFSPQSHPAVQTQTLYAGQLVIAVHAKHPLLKIKKGGSLERVSDYPAVLPKSYQGIDNCETHPVFDLHRIRPNATLVFDNYEIAIEKIRQSNAWGLLPDWLVKQSRLSALTAERWDAPVTIAALWPKNRILTRVMQGLLQRLAERFSPSAASPPRA